MWRGTLRDGRVRVPINSQVVVYFWALAGLVLVSGGARGAEVGRHRIETSMGNGGMENTGKVDDLNPDTLQPHQTLALSPDLPTIMEPAKLNETMNESDDEIEHQPARNSFAGLSDMDAKKSTTNVALQSEFKDENRRIRRRARGGRRGGGRRGGGKKGGGSGGGQKPKRRKEDSSNEATEQTGRDTEEYDSRRGQNHQNESPQMTEVQYGSRTFRIPYSKDNPTPIHLYVERS